MISFILNNESITTDQPEGMTLLDFIRYHKDLKGTKIGCREGDCGACTVLTGKLINEDVSYKSITSCITPLAAAAGCHVVTIEGINNDELTPVQQSVVEEGGTQCGFCTAGFIMSLTGSCININTEQEQIIAAIDGNICRCTGYKSLERAAQRIADLMKELPESGHIQWLSDKQIVPSYFNEIPQRLKQLMRVEQKFSGIITGGGTDLYVQKHETMQESSIHHIGKSVDLNYIYEENNLIHTGASVTVEEVKNNVAYQKYFSEINNYLKLVSSTPIRNLATMAGNFVNASPIGDMTIFYLALNTELTLSHNGAKRKVYLKDFYKGYKILDKLPDEIIEEFIFPTPSPGTFFNFEKVSKRTHLDIASVNSAISYQIQNNLLFKVQLSAGGVFAFPLFLKETSQFLNNKPITVETISAAISIVQSEIKPISDARGSEQYKRKLLTRLFLAHFERHFTPWQLKELAEA